MSILLSVLKRYLQTPQYLHKNILWRFPKTVSKTHHIFVIGAPRSGTTLLQTMLASHTELFSIEGETALFSYQNIFNKRHFGLQWDEIEQLFRHCADVVDFFDSCVVLLKKRYGRKVFIEKTPQHILRLKFLLSHFANSKFVNIIRDGRDCFCSAKHQPFIPQRKSAVTFARYWKRCINARVFIGERINIFDLKYEDFVSDPHSRLTELMEFLGFKIEDRQLDPSVYGKDHRSKHSFFDKLSGSVSNTSVGRWKSELTQKESVEFSKIAENELKYYNYTV